MNSIITPEAFRILRTDKGISQAALAKCVSIQRSYISLFESGKYVLEDDVLEAMIDHLTNGQDYPGETVRNSGQHLDVMEEPLIDPERVSGGLLVSDRLDPDLIDDIFQELHEKTREVRVLLEKKVPEGWLFGIDEEAADLIQYRTLALMARCFVLMQKVRGFEIRDLSDDSIGARIDSEIVGLT